MLGYLLGMSMSMVEYLSGMFVHLSGMNNEYVWSYLVYEYGYVLPPLGYEYDYG